MASVLTPARVISASTPRSFPQRRLIVQWKDFSRPAKLSRPLAINSRRWYSTPPSKAPSKNRAASKLYKSADDAVADIQSGSTIFSSGFGLCGVAETLIEAIERRGKESLHSLTAVSNNTGIEGVGGLSHIAKSGQVKKLIISFLGNNKALERRFLNGDLAVELCPQGSLAERIRAGGAGIPAFYTPTAANTLVETGKIPSMYDSKGNVIAYGTPREVREFNGRKYLMETALTGDVAIIRAHKVDEAGNCCFRYTTKAYGVIMAKAAKVTIVEAEEIVPIGALHPDNVDLPGIFVDRIVPATAKKNIEILKIRKPADPNATVSEAQAKRDRIARRTAKELHHGYYVNLGVGLPTRAPEYLPKDVRVWLQSENGILGMGDYPTESEVDADIVNAGKETVTLVPGASTFDSADSFGMIRGGHVDVTVLGALQVSASGDLANYMIPGKTFKGMGGAMDLVGNPEETKIVVATEHVAKDGSPKVVQDCKLPLTGAKCISTIITDMCVFQVDRVNGGLTLTEIAPGLTVDDVKAKTDATFKVADNVISME
ncbi:succinyl-CoA:3-ketoacid-coenzyme A transferase subunit B [Rhizodiscina lignyota]|uniref:Succinyl-CoA:3-ketoacid-coenzyme A transferase n=1 Tax=Rhizodiscina lignyota TaxID=1504668 RepID=A0A9P4M0F3_9PEZI|nr:succinyl-CoA:3-ketoacid-coenzyme A transferase subunit B [Rhizodiscina lignyota]